jgi:hypothetical protein
MRARAPVTVMCASRYTEYYQWSNGYNSNSPQQSVNAGQTLQGTLTYIPSSDSYNLTQTVLETGTTSQQIVKCQNGKKFVIPYVVYEKTFPCASYPPDEIVTFKDIQIQCDGKDCTDSVVWTPKVVDANCDMTAHVDKYPSELYITWSTKAASAYDNLTSAELYDLNFIGWAKQLGIPRPVE